VNAVPFRGGKKGTDSGIDGLIYVKPEGKTTEKTIVVLIPSCKFRSFRTLNAI
jgi:hypothetical protein